MSVKILHCADLHLDSPFDSLPENKAAQRRKEQRETLLSIARMASDEKADVVLLSGDLFDSTVAYYETGETLIEALRQISAPVFISPGNHDYYCQQSPYAYLEFPENVHIFTSQEIQSVVLEALGCRIYGGAFTGTQSPSLLSGFKAEDDGLINIMVLHGDTAGNTYNPISQEQIASSGLDYLALGHVHTFSGICSAGSTAWAYPGCALGRGFDETGDKGVITGTVSKGSTDLKFLPVPGRRYRIVTGDITGWEASPTEFASSLITDDMAEDIIRIVITGESDLDIDCDAISDKLDGQAFHITVKSRVRPVRNIWDGISEDTLRGSFLRIMKKKFDSAQEDRERDLIFQAVLAALDVMENREVQSI